MTEGALQQRYPPRPGAVTTHYSSVELPEAAFVKEPKIYHDGPLRLISVGSMEHLYKAQDVLLEAIAGCSANVQLTLVGDGRCRVGLEELAAKLGIHDRVDFRGGLPAGGPVRTEPRPAPTSSYSPPARKACPGP